MVILKQLEYEQAVLFEKITEATKNHSVAFRSYMAKKRNLIMKNLKRDNFTVDEIINLINGLMLIDGDGKEIQVDGKEIQVESYNDGIRSVADMFYDFRRPLEEMGAMAYDVDSKFVVHVGYIPDEMKIQIKKKTS